MGRKMIALKAVALHRLQAIVVVLSALPVSHLTAGEAETTKDAVQITSDTTLTHRYLETTLLGSN